MRYHEFEATTPDRTSMGAFWSEIASSGDAFARAMSEYSNRPDVTILHPSEVVLVRIDEQPAFMNGGGLALEYGDQVVTQSRQKAGQGDFASMDFHMLDNIGNASAHGLPPFSYMYLLEGEVKIVYPNDNSAVSYKELVDGSHTVRDVIAYLKKRETSRLLTALLLETDLYNVGQILWPDHANNFDEECSRIPETNDVIIKGTNSQSDSLSCFVAGDGGPVLFERQSAAGLLSKNLKEKSVNYAVFAGLAGDYCVLLSAESARLAQEVAKLFQCGNDADWEGAIKQKAQTRDDLEISAEQMASMLEMVKAYIASGMMLDPEVQVCIALDHTDVVRGPSGISTQEDVKQLINRYKEMGIQLVTL